MEHAVTKDADRRSVVAFYDTWGRHVVARAFAEARTMFEPDMVAFGTFADFIHGIDAVERDQWRQVWPMIADFRFATEHTHVDVSPDRLMASAAVPWTSTGFDQDGRPFPRNGRATVTLRRTSVDAPWRGVHTHFSLNRGTPGRSYGQPTAVA